MAGRLATPLAGALAIAAAISFLIGPVREALEHRTYGFPAYYTSSRLVLDGRWTPDVYDNDWFHEQSAELSGGILEIYRPNPPMASLIAVPIAWLDYGTARRTWLVLQVLAIAGLIGALLGALPALRAPPLALGFTALVLAWSPLRDDVRLGQAYTFVTLLQALAVLGLARSRLVGVGLALGATLASKVASIPLAVVLAVRGRVAPLAWASVLLGLGALATLPFAGIDGWRRFIAVFVEDTLHPGPELAVPAYQSVSGLLAHFLVADPRWNPAPVADTPALAAALGIGLVIAVAVVTVALARRGPEILAVGLALVAGLLVINLAQEYHGAMLLPAAAIALVAWRSGAARRGRTPWLTVALVLAGGPFFYRDVPLPGGWADVLWYPRLAGAILLWAWLALELARARSADPGAMQG